MKKNIVIAGFLCLLPTVSLASDDVLLRQGDTVLTSRDVRLAVETFIPEANRATLFANEKSLRDFIAQMFAVRALAAEARERELSADERWKIDITAERAASEVQVAHLIATRPAPDFVAAAREFYLANPQQFATPEQVNAQHILIRSANRSDDEARMLANHVAALARQPGQDFAALAKEYSEDPSGERGGNLGFFGRGRMVKPFEDAVFALNSPGEIVGPVQTEFGYHVIRFVDRRPAGVQAFETVQDRLVQNEQVKFRRIVTGEEFARVGKLPGIEVNQEAIRALVQPIDFKGLTHPTPTE